METANHIRSLVRDFALKSSYGTEPNFAEVRALGSAVLPFMIEEYPKARRWQQRASYVYTAVRYARTSPDAIKLALLALEDRSREVRYRACMLLACSLDKSTLGALQALRQHPDDTTRAHAEAAIDAIQSENHHYFVDRTHSGKVFCNFDGLHGAHDNAA